MSDNNEKVEKRIIMSKDEEIFPSIIIMKIYDTHTDPNLINKPTGSLKHYTLIYSPIR
jgi:hypothetical protein